MWRKIGEGRSDVHFHGCTIPVIWVCRSRIGEVAQSLRSGAPDGVWRFSQVESDDREGQTLKLAQAESPTIPVMLGAVK
jgi:hypothetical protein